MDLQATFHNPIQIGLIVRDLDKALANFKEVLGMDGFRIADFPPPDHPDVVRKYHGKDGDFTAKFCFYNWGNIEFEIIQPLSGDNIWSDYLDGVGEMGLHHIKFMVPEHEEVRKHFESLGISVSQMGEGVGPNAGRHWVFYNTMDKLGFDIEMLNSIVKQ